MIERSISDGVIKTKKDDAASIVGEDFAEELEKRERSGIVGKSEAVVVRTATEDVPVPVVVPPVSAAAPEPIVPLTPKPIQAEVHMFDMNHPLATLLSAVATTYDGVVTKSELTRAQKFQALQTSLDALAVAIKSEVDAKTPPTTVDVEETIRRVLGEMLPAFMAQSTPVASGQGRPEPRQVTPSAAATFRSTPAAAAPNSLRALARRSVGLPVEEGVSHG